MLTLDDKEIFANPWWSYRIRRYAAKNHKGTYNYISVPDGVIIVPILNDGRILLIDQYRIINESRFFEFPCGGAKGSLMESAKRELLEEAGGRARELLEIGTFAPYTGVSTEICHVFLAKGTELSNPKREVSEDIKIVLTAPPMVEDILLKTGDGKALCAWTIAKSHILA